MRVEYDIQGVSNEAILENIEATLSIIREKDRDDLTPGMIVRMHDRAPTEIQRAVEPFGYYHAEIDGSLARGEKDRFRVRYRIALGEPVRVRNVRVALNGDAAGRPPFPRLAAEFPLRKGDVLDQRRYKQHKAAFASAAVDSGYLDASFTTSVIRIDRSENIADIELVFDTGARYYFGPVTFDTTSVDERVMRAYLTFEPGDPFRYDRLMTFQSTLGGAPYFGRVAAIAEPDSATHEVPIHVELEDQRPRRYEVGVGYGTDTGPRVLLNAELRRLNRKGHRFSGRANVSFVELSLTAEYVIPSLYPDTHAYSIGAVVARLEPDAYITNRLAAGPTRSQPRFGWLESITLSYEHEDFTVGSDDGVTDFVIGGVTYRKKRADDDIAPTRGQRFSVGLRGAEQKVLSSESFLSFTTSAKAVRTLPGGFRLIGRVEGGATSTPAFRELPPTIRFFAGGDNSVRGYSYESLGPRDEAGRVIGGRLLLATSAEIQYPVWGKFGLAAFYDAGNAFESVDSGRMEQGAGGGLRWQSPVGPVRLDLAFALRHDDWRIHFTMGPDL